MLFVHIPKAAGSTIERVFKRSGWKMDLYETWKTHPRLMAVRRCSPQHYHAAVLQELLALDRFDATFTVTREPISRFRSEYLMRNHLDPRVDAGSLDDWAARVLASREQDPYTLDNHLRPQHEFLVPGACVYRLEQGVDEIIKDLDHRFGLGLNANVPRALHSTKRAGVPSEHVEVSPALEESLRDLYARDFELFGY